MQVPVPGGSSVNGHGDHDNSPARRRAGTVPGVDLPALRYLSAAVLAAALAISSAPGAVAAKRPKPGTIAEAQLGPSVLVYMFGLAPGPDGNLWFTDLGCMGLGRCAIGRITPKGKLTVYHRRLNKGSVPFAITPGPDGNLWFTAAGSAPAIGRITPTGQITEFSAGLNPGSVPFEITDGPDGDLWFTDQGTTPAIGRITPSGKITEYSAGLLPGAVPFGITAGPHHTLWFTDHGCSVSGTCAIGDVSASGQISETTSGLRRDSQPLGIAAGPGGAIWFADSSGAIGRITRRGQISETRHGLYAGSSPVGISPGPDGNMWFTDEGATSAIGRVSPRMHVKEFKAGLENGAKPAIITAAADGRLWFSDEGSDDALGSALSGEPAAVRTRPVVSGVARIGNELRCSAAQWATWAYAKPSTKLFEYDGYRWLRNGAPIANQHSDRYRVVAADRGRQLSCRVTVTYPAPFYVTARAASDRVKVQSDG